MIRVDGGADEPVTLVFTAGFSTPCQVSETGRRHVARKERDGCDEEAHRKIGPWICGSDLVQMRFEQPGR